MQPAEAASQSLAQTGQGMAPLRVDLSSLNPPQAEAVRHTEGPLLVLAGAGTGKTRVLTTRIAYILAEGLAHPANILAVTFTNKAAREMKKRIANLVGPQSSSLWLGTFHSLALRILRSSADLLNFPRDFAVIDADDSIRLIKTIMREQHIDDKKNPANMISNIIQRWKDQALSPSQVQEREEENDIASAIYNRYQSRLKQLQVMDFGDLLMANITLFRNHPDVLKRYQQQFKYILVDEYQDTNSAQYLWLRMLAEYHNNIACVGDEDQSIYGWRGAEIGHILGFEKTFSRSGLTVKTVRLEQNYRSTRAILGAASALISHNSERLGKTLFTNSKSGDLIRVVSLWDDRAEAAYVAQEIESQQSIHATKLDQIAILVRAGHQTRSLEECCISHQIPYRVIGGLRFYERREIKDAISYMRIVSQPTNDLALERIINLPKRGVGKATLDKLRLYAREYSISLHKSIRENLDANALKGKAASSLKHLLGQLDIWRELLHEKPHSDVVEQLLSDSGYLAMWQADKSLEAEGRVENLKELLVALDDFASLSDFLEHVSLVSDMDTAPDGDMVSIMTMHSSKGLEFDCVFLCGWEENLFPSQRTIDEKGAAGLEEERRLAYVGMTRARKHLFISFTSSRYLHGQVVNYLPSRFLDELPEEHIERLNMVASQSGGFYQPKPKQRFHDNTRHAPAANPAKQGGKFPINSRVFHQKFGYGRVIDISGDHITVNFEKSTTRTLKSNFLETT